MKPKANNLLRDKAYLAQVDVDHNDIDLHSSPETSSLEEDISSNEKSKDQPSNNTNNYV